MPKSDNKPKLKKAPKKVKRGTINKNKHINTLSQMMIPFEKDKQKKLNVDYDNFKIERDSDYDGSTSSSESSDGSDSDEFEFKPTIQLGNRKRIMSKDDDDFSFDGVNIKYIPTSKDDIEERYLHKEGIVPRGYSNFILLNGSIGSGKTNCLINMLLNPLIYGFDGSGKHYYDNLFVLTNSNDDAYDVLMKEGVLKPSHIKHQPEESDLKLILDQQKKAIKACNGDASKYPITAIIFDDIVDNLQFIKSKYFKLCAIRPRQLNICVFLLSQYFNAIPRLIRMQAQNLILFAGNKTEEEIYSEMLTPAGLSQKQFGQILNYAWTKRENDSHPFIHINRKQAVEKRFMRNFNERIIFPEVDN
jgi:hypothetical protein